MNPIRQYRERARVSQYALAASLGVSQARISQLESGEAVPIELCPSIENETGVRCEELRDDVQWQRDDEGRVIAYTVPIAEPANDSEAGNG